MRITLRIAALALLLPLLSFAQQQKEKTPTIASEVESRLSAGERELVALGEAMPDSKFGFAPSAGEFKGVRNFGGQLKHVAAYNYLVCSAIKGEKAPETGGENGPENVRSKGEILKYLKDSYAYCHKAYATINAQNAVEPIQTELRGPTTRLFLAALAATHTFDHYGQAVVYLRMNGIVPPATARRQQQSRVE